MIELKRINVHRIVDSKEKAQRLISEGFSIIKDEKNLMGLEIEKAVETIREKVKKAKIKE